MKIHLELHCETLAQVRAELEAFLALAGSAPSNTETAQEASAADNAFSNGAEDSARQQSVPKKVRAKSAADIALGLDPGDGVEEPKDDVVAEDELDPEVTSEGIPAENDATPRSEAEALLADKAQLQFEFDHVLALQGRAAALGIVRGLLPSGKKTKLKDIEALPVELIAAAIEALQAARAS